jgi:hypothetical protein
LLPWLLGRRDASRGDRRHRALPLIGAWKMLDNLRRTLSAPAGFLALMAGWTLPLQQALLWTGFVLATVALPSLIPVAAAIVPRRAGITVRSHARAFGKDLMLAARQIAFQITFLPHLAWLMLDAIGRTLFRLFVSRRNLLQWVTADQASVSARPGIAGSYRKQIGGVLLTLTALLAVFWLRGDVPWIVAPFALLWLAAPAVALWISRAPQTASHLSVSAQDALALRLVARRTWRYFEQFVTADDHMLPPDNFQEDPRAVLAHRTSPTNLGLYLLSTVSARDFGWIGTLDATERLEAILHGMVEAFAFFGCVPQELWWDNPKTVATTILRGRQRELNQRWQALASHYNFEPLFCLPARGNEKPHVENRVKLLERQWATPVPQAKDLSDLNAFLIECCRRDWLRTLAGQSETIDARFAAERASALPLPQRSFEAAVSEVRHVDKYQTVAWEKNRYSVPRRHAFATVTVKAYVDRVEVIRDGVRIAQHERSYGQGEQVLDPLHYCPRWE